jgi:precorrin-4/cobalt-precorrin-4 C11-methyltransferase
MERRIVVLFLHADRAKGVVSTVPSIYFIGAGPGDVSLLTIKAYGILRRADLILYADSLVHPTIRSLAKPGAVVKESSGLTLEEMIALMVEAARVGHLVARVQSGDPSLYGAIAEQISAVEATGLSYEIIPGVSSAFAAAARLGIELTVPGKTQTVILSRCSGRTIVPAKERLRELARHQATMVLFLSISRIRQVVKELQAAGYPADTPMAVVSRVTWEGEQILRGSLGSILEQVRAARLTRQALILVGPALATRTDANGAGPRSKLYDPAFHHLFRHRRPNGLGTKAEKVRA